MTVKKREYWTVSDGKPYGVLALCNRWLLSHRVLLQANSRGDCRNSTYQAPATKNRKPGLVPGFFVPVNFSLREKNWLPCATST